MERFIFFSDAVFAFSLTLLATSLKLPAHAERLDHAALLAALGEMVPVLTCYLITFGVVARLWVRHHRTFERIHDYDDRSILLNFVLLLFVSLEPFTIDLLMSTHSDNLPFGIYTGMLALTGAASFAVYWHSRRTPGLIAESPSRETFLRECAGQLGLPLMTGLLCLASFWFERSRFPLVHRGRRGDHLWGSGWRFGPSSTWRTGEGSKASRGERGPGGSRGGSGPRPRPRDSADFDSAAACSRSPLRRGPHSSTTRG